MTVFYRGVGYIRGQVNRHLLTPLINPTKVLHLKYKEVGRPHIISYRIEKVAAVTSLLKLRYGKISCRYTVRYEI